MSVFATSLANAIDKINAFTEALKQRPNKKINTVATADNSAKLGGLNYNAAASAIPSGIASHVSNKANPHGDTVNTVGTKSITAFDNMVINTPELDSFPTSSYGDRSSMPIDVSGSFSGAGAGYAEFYAPILEEDGTLTVIRNGFDGGKYRAYYSHLKNAASAVGSFTDYVRTTKEYKPNCVTPGRAVLGVMRSIPEVIMGVIGNVSDGKDTTRFIALTNGYSAMEKHDSALITGPWPFPSDASPVIVGDKLYLIGGLWDAPIGFTVGYVPLADIRAGGSVTITPVTGWTITTFNGVKVNQPNIYWHEKLLSRTPGEDTFLYFNSNVWKSDTIAPMWAGMQIFAECTPSGKINLMVGIDSWYINYNTGTHFRPWISAFFEIDPVAKTAVLDPYYDDYFQINQADDGAMTFLPTKYHSIGKPTMVGTETRNAVDNVFHFDDGVKFAILDGNVPTEPYAIARYKVDGVTHKSDMCKRAFVSAKSPVASRSFKPLYGSAIGTNLANLQPLSATSGIVSSAGRMKDGDIGHSIVFFKIGAAGYQYSTPNDGKIPGFAPAIDRKFIHDMYGSDPIKYSVPRVVTEISDQGYKVHGSYFIYTNSHEGVWELDADGKEVVPGKRRNIDANAFASVVNAVVATDTNNNPADITHLAAVAFFPEFMNGRGVLIVKYRRLSTQSNYTTRAVVQITSGSRDTTITGLSLYSQSTATVDMTGSAYVGVSYVELVTGITAYKCGEEGWVVGLSPPLFSGNGSGGHFAVLTLFIDKKPDGSFDMDYANWMYGGAWYAGGSQGFWATPELGFGITNPMDGGTKHVWRPYIKTKADLVSAIAGPSMYNYGAPSQVIVAQELAQGWVVYFTNPVPVFMAGKQLTAPQRAIDLSIIDPAPQNSTFYVYVTKSGDAVDYLISRNKQTETKNVMFIGTVVTGAGSITEINVSKYSRIEVSNIDRIILKEQKL